MGKIRKKDFKIGCVHGKLDPDDRSTEAILRTQLFLIGMLRVEITRNQSIDIRIVAYEMPLETGQSRGQCIDLLGYDQNKRPWIVELKKTTSKESIGQIIEQINRYESLFQEIRGYVQDEIRNKFHWNDFTFSGETGRIILAGRDFFQGENLESYESLDIYCCSFSRIQDEIRDGKVSLLEKNRHGITNLRIHNK